MLHYVLLPVKGETPVSIVCVAALSDGTADVAGPYHLASVGAADSVKWVARDYSLRTYVYVRFK